MTEATGTVIIGVDGDRPVGAEYAMPERETTARANLDLAKSTGGTIASP